MIENSTVIQTALKFPYLKGLNEAQQSAVLATEGPALVLAGAGTGKTRVLTTRLAHILLTGRARPHEILTVTFTNKAAMEMKERVSHLLGRPVEGWWLGTFHALAARMLRRYADRVGLTSNFTILDTDDQLRLLKQVIAVHNLDSKKNPPKLVLDVIERWKDRAIPPGSIGTNDAGDIADGKMPQIYRDYQDRLRTLNACDFGDLLLHMVTLLKDPQHADILDHYAGQFRYILVDEYQDTNVAQYLWLRLLAQRHKNICCVGDDDQSIYGWRGAEVENILRFEKDFPGATVVRLEQNYRSTNTILNAANAVIAHNSQRLGKNLWSEAGDGEKIRLRAVWDGPQEAVAIADDIEDLQRKGTSLKDIAILVRASHQTREFEERFIKTAIPYRVVGGLRFYERMEIRDAIAYFRATVQPRDDLALERIINTPKRGIGDASMQKVFAFARARSLCLSDAILLLIETDELPAKARGALRQLMADFVRWRDMLTTMRHTEVAALMLDESGYTAMWQADKSIEAQGRLENLKELVSALAEFGNLDSFLEHVALVMENAEKSGEDMVTLMTLHGAKGLEFNVVFLPGWEEGLFPSQRSMDEKGLTGLEEERRLAYVGLTRARQRAYIYHATSRQVYGSWMNAMPSRFIAELPEDYLDIASEPGIGGGHGGYGASYGGGYTSRTPGRSLPGHGSSSYTIESVSARLESESGYAPSDRVFHQKFGYGTVISVDHDKLDIQFDKAGRKKVVDSFVTRAP